MVENGKVRHPDPIEGKMAMRKTVLLGLLAGLPTVAAAADLTQRDAGCQHIATVQYLDCEVAVLYSCPAVKGLASPLVREESYTDKGLNSFEVDTANGGMVVTGDAQGSYLIRTDTPTLVETAMADVIKTGHGLFKAEGSVTMFGAKKPAGQKITVTATGETAVLNGQNMLVFTANVAIDLPAPMGPAVTVSKAYLVPSLGVYLAGEETSGTYFKPDDTPHKPMAIAMPGTPEFDKTKPGFCGGSLSLLESPRLPDTPKLPAKPNLTDGVPA